MEKRDSCTVASINTHIYVLLHNVVVTLRLNSSSNMTVVAGALHFVRRKACRCTDCCFQYAIFVHHVDSLLALGLRKEMLSRLHYLTHLLVPIEYCHTIAINDHTLCDDTAITTCGHRLSRLTLDHSMVNCRLYSRSMRMRYPAPCVSRSSSTDSIHMSFDLL